MGGRLGDVVLCGGWVIWWVELLWCARLAQALRDARLRVEEAGAAATQEQKDTWMNVARAFVADARRLDEGEQQAANAAQPKKVERLQAYDFAVALDWQLQALGEIGSHRGSGGFGLFIAQEAVTSWLRAEQRLSERRFSPCCIRCLIVSRLLRLGDACSVVTTCLVEVGRAALPSTQRRCAGVACGVLGSSLHGRRT